MIFNKMSKKTKAYMLALLVIILAGISLFIALRLKLIGEKPVAPKPKAEDIFEGWVTPGDQCIKEFNVFCKIPSPAPVLKGPTPPVHSRVDLSWDCNLSDVDGYTIKKYVYPISGSGCSKKCVKPAGLSPTIFDKPKEICNYTDSIPNDLAKCVDYEVEAKNTNDLNACTVNNDVSCCLVKSNTISICGLPAEPSFVRREQGNYSIDTIMYKDHSEIEKGFKVYKRTTGFDNFQDISNSEIPIVTLAPVPGKEGDVVYTVSYKESEVYSIRAYTDLCGCEAPVVPTLTPTSTSTPIPTQTPGGPTATPIPPTSTPSSTPFPTSTPAPPGEPYCDYLTASPVSGNVVLTVSFSGKGYDKTRIKGYRFTFGDGEKAEYLGSFTAEYIQTTQHSYSGTGTFIAQLEILDDGDHWRTRNECKKAIVVSGGGAGVTSTPVPQVTTTTATTAIGAVSTPTTAQRTVAVASPTEVELPKAGFEIPALGGLLGGFLLLAIGLVLIF